MWFCFVWLQVSDQQVTLEKAGVPGFFVTNNPLDIKVQMYLLDFILRLSKHQNNGKEEIWSDLSDSMTHFVPSAAYCCDNPLTICIS
jgi:hypothetical protein